MKIGFLSDAHGNHLAVAGCIRLLRDEGVDSIYFLGDAVGYLPGERAVLQLLREHHVHCQKGNHEAMLLGDLPLVPKEDDVYRIERVRHRLSSEDREFIASWPESRVVCFEGRKILLVHGSPNNHLEGYIYPDSDLSAFDHLEHDCVFMGHTHHPFAAQRQRMLVVNVGSCGISRDQGDLLSCAVYDSTTGGCEILRLRMPAWKIINHFGEENIPQEVQRVLVRQASKPIVGKVIEGSI